MQQIPNLQEIRNSQPSLHWWIQGENENHKRKRGVNESEETVTDHSGMTWRRSLSKSSNSCNKRVWRCSITGLQLALTSCYAKCIQMMISSFHQDCLIVLKYETTSHIVRLRKLLSKSLQIMRSSNLLCFHQEIWRVTGTDVTEIVDVAEQVQLSNHCDCWPDALSIQLHQRPRVWWERGKNCLALSITVIPQ